MDWLLECPPHIPVSCQTSKHFDKNRQWHDKYFKKELDKNTDNGEEKLINKSPHHVRFYAIKDTLEWQLVFAQFCQKNCKRLRHMPTQCLWSKKLSNRGLIEYYFGRQCTFTLFGSKWHLDKHKYSRFLGFVVMLTNAHVIWNPLRCSDRALLNSIQNRISFIGKSQSK